MNKRQRRLRNFLLDPSRQLRSAVHFIGLYVVYSVLLSSVFLHVTFSQHSFVMTHIGQSEEANFVDMFQNPIIVEGLIEVSVLFLAFLLVAMTLTILFSHRVFGPLIPIKRQLEALYDGDYSKRVTLRRNDELKDIAEAINRLAERLEEREKGQEPQDVLSALKQLNTRLDEREIMEI